MTIQLSDRPLCFGMQGHDISRFHQAATALVCKVLIANLLNSFWSPLDKEQS
jgi:hypothetical protein